MISVCKPLGLNSDQRGDLPLRPEGHRENQTSLARSLHNYGAIISLARSLHANFQGTGEPHWCANEEASSELHRMKEPLTFLINFDDVLSKVRCFETDHTYHLQKISPGFPLSITIKNNF